MGRLWHPCGHELLTRAAPVVHLCLSGPGSCSNRFGVSSSQHQHGPVEASLAMRIRPAALKTQ